MEHGASENVKKQSQMEMIIKTEVDAAATTTTHIDNKTDLNHLKQEPGLLQSVKSEPALLVKEEVLEDSDQDGNDQQCVQGASTPAGTGSLNEACSTSLFERLLHPPSAGNWLNVNNEPGMDIGPTVLQHMDIHHTIKKYTMGALLEENTIVDDFNEAMPLSEVKKESVEDKLRDGRDQQCVPGTSTPAGTGSRTHSNCQWSLLKRLLQLNAYCAFNAGDRLNVKNELGMDIGPTVLQHMDLHHTTNKHTMGAPPEENTIVDDFNEAMLPSEVKKESVEDKLRDGNDQQCVQGTSTPAGTGSLNESNSLLKRLLQAPPSAGNWLNVNNEPGMDIGPTVLQHMDIHHTINKHTMGASPEENTIVDDFNEAMPRSEVRKESVEDKLRDGNDQQCVQGASTPAGTVSLNERNSLLKHLLQASPSAGNCLNVNNEPGMEIGPTVLQHIHHTIKKHTMGASPEEITIVDDSNEAMPLSEVRKGSVEYKLRDGNDQQCVQGTSTPADTGSLNESNRLLKRLLQAPPSAGNWLHVNNEPGMDIGPTVLQHMDIHHITNKHTMGAPPEENTIVDDCNEAMLPSEVKKGSVDHKLRDVNDQQCVQGTSTPADTGSLNESNFLLQRFLQTSPNAGNCLNVNNELGMDIGPTVLQHMDIHHIINKHTMGAPPEENTIVDYCNEAMSRSEVKKGSVEDKLRADKTIPCKYCGQKVREDDNDETHVKFCRGQQKDHLHQHLTISSKGFKCDRTITKAHLLSVHNKLHQRNSRKISMINSTVVTASSNQSYQCDTCDARFTRKSYLIVHMAVHTGEKPYRCDTCNARFALNSRLSRHRLIHTKEKPYPCDTCDARFADKSTLFNHRRIHTGEKPYRCATCDARFTRKTHLNAHRSVHAREKCYQCDTCNAKFARKRYLVRHRIVHMVEKPYRCVTCNARFIRKGNLIEHRNVHTGEKRYKCDTCDARFAHRSNLFRHRRVHTVEKLYRCAMCDAKFSCNTALTYHMRVHTGFMTYYEKLCP